MCTTTMYILHISELNLPHLSGQGPGDHVIATHAGLPTTGRNEKKVSLIKAGRSF